jgi:hypothetical protein
MGANYSVYKLPNISSAIFVNTENLQTCLAKAKTTKDNQACITANVSSSVPQGKSPVTYFGTGESVHTSNGKTTITPASSLPTSNCYEKFNSSNDPNDTNIESNKIFCFNGMFTILTIFVLILLLIFINVNSKNTVAQKSLL